MKRIIVFSFGLTLIASLAFAFSKTELKDYIFKEDFTSKEGRETMKMDLLNFLEKIT